MLLVLPLDSTDTSFEAWEALHDATPLGFTFEGHYQVVIHSKFEEEEREQIGAINEQRLMNNAPPRSVPGKAWNQATSRTLRPGDVAEYGIGLVTSPTVEMVEETLIRNHFPVAVGIPSFVIHQGMRGAKLRLRWLESSSLSLEEMVIEPADALIVARISTFTVEGVFNDEYRVAPMLAGRARITMVFSKLNLRRRLTVHYFVSQPVDKLVRVHDSACPSNDQTDAHVFTR